MSNFKVKVGQMSINTIVDCTPGMSYGELLQRAQAANSSIKLTTTSSITIFYSDRANIVVPYNELKDRTMVGTETIVLTLTTKPKGNN